MSVMLSYIIRKAGLAFIVSILALSYYLYKNNKLALPEKETMIKERQELIAAVKKRYGDISMEEVTSRVNEKLLAMANMSAMTAEAARLKQNPESFQRAIAAYGESAHLVSEIDKMMALRYTYLKGKTLCQFQEFFPDNQKTPEAVQEGIAIIEGVMKEWDKKKDAALWNEMKAILEAHKSKGLRQEKAVAQG